MSRRDVVYLLDDDPDILRGLERLLKVNGFRSRLFQSVEAFFAAFEDEKEALCLLLDIHLDGCSGLEVRRRLTQSGATLPVIFITAKDSETMRRVCDEIGCAAYLAKPFTAKSLLEAIDLAGRQNRDPVGSFD